MQAAISLSHRAGLLMLRGSVLLADTLAGLIAEGLWTDRRHRLPSPHQPRRRRECLGELVQIDGSEHAWFEARDVLEAARFRVLSQSWILIPYPE